MLAELIKKSSDLGKNKRRIQGIYIIFHEESNKGYIGSSVDIGTRWSNHKWELKSKRHPNSHFQRIVDKYGYECLTYKLLEEVEDEKNLCSRENHYLELLDKEERINHKPPERRGPVSDELREKFSRSFTGRKLTDEHKEKVRLGNLGKRGSQHQIDAAKLANTGKIISEETRKKMSESAKKRINKSTDPLRKLTPEIAYQIRVCAREGMRGTDIAKKFNINYSTARKIVNGHTWKSAPWPE